MQDADSGPSQLAELVGRTEGPRPWRRLFHLLGGLSVAWVVHVLSPQSPSARWLFGIMLAIALAGDLLRLQSDTFNRFAFRTFRVLLSPREADRLSISWFMAGVFLVLWLPAEAHAVAALVVLAIADPVANVVGSRIGKHPLGKGTVEGTAAFAASAFVALTPFVGAWTAVPVAFVAAAAEAVPTRLDDNFAIPVATALSLWAMSVI